MKRLLFVSPFYPHPLDRGQHVRIQHLLRACSRDHAVTLLVAQPSDGPDPAVASLVDRVVLVDEHPDDLNGLELLRLALRLHSLRPRALRLLAAYHRQLRTLDLHEYDVVWLERLALAPLFVRSGRPVVIDLDDLEHRKWWRASKVSWRSSANGVRATARHGYYTLRYALEELVRPHQVRAVVVASPQDAEYLRRRGVNNAWTVPNGVDVAAERPRRRHERVRSLLYLGNLGYSANVDALEYARDEVLPEIRRRGADVTLHVIGAGDTAAIREGHPGVVFHGFVEDLGRAFVDHDALLAPIRVGGGTKLKVLEALAQGLPVVTTSVGAEGLGLDDAGAAAIADTAESIADAVLALDADPQYAELLATRAWDVARRFSWDAVEDELADRLSSL